MGAVSADMTLPVEVFRVTCQARETMLEGCKTPLGCAGVCRNREII